jgi:photosystem II stability/assembly factor-like uncharacterized protein
MKNILRVSAAMAAVTLTGAGCFGGDTALTSGGVWQSTDAGKTWEQTAAVPSATGVGSLAEVDVTTFAVDPQDDSAIYAGTQANGLFYSLDGGTSWQRPEDALVRQGNIISVAVSSKDVCTYFVAKSDRVMKTEDCGRTFIADRYLENQPDESITAMALDWYDPETVWIGNSAGDVIRSLDGGESWTTLTHLDNDITSLAVSNADSRIVFVGTKTNGLIRTADGGATWVEYEKTLKDYKASDRVYGFAQNADGSVMVMNTQYGLLLSKDQGATWSGVSLISSSGEVQITAVAVAPNSGDVLYYGTAGTLNRSTSGGSAWTTTELPTSRAVGALLIDPADNAHVYLGSRTLETK